MGECVEKIVHDVCGRNALQVFMEEDDTYNGHCFHCHVHVANPYEEGHIPPKPDRAAIARWHAEQLAEISTYGFHELPDRKLRKETLEQFGIRVGVSEEDGVTPVTHFYPYTLNREDKGYKVRIIEGKKMYSLGQLRDVDLFGWDQAVAEGGRKLFITEGELDAPALYQVLKDSLVGGKWEGMATSVVSLPKGSAAAAKSIAAVLHKIREHFKEVVLVFDNDEPGRHATKEVLKIAPDFLSVTLAGNDPNEMLMTGRSRALAQTCAFKAAKPKNTQLVWGSSLHEAGRTEAEWGVSWPWAKLTDLTRGIRTGETIYMGAGVKMGKSEVVNALAAHLIVEHGWKVFMAKPEEANRKSYQMVVGKVEGHIFHDPKIPFNYDAYDRGSKVIGDNLAMVNLYQHLGWESLKMDIAEAATQGCKAIIIDPITNLTNGMEASAANIKLQAIAQELASMALDLDIVIFIFCHLLAPKQGEPHERGGNVMSTQFAGSRAMMRSCNYMIGIEGNKDPDLSMEERNIRTLVVLEDREFGASGKIPLYWDSKTSLFNEMHTG